MHVAVIGDLHLCSDTRCREFAVGERAFLGFLDALERSHGVIVVAGDTYNLDHARVLGAYERELRATRRRFPALTARLDSAPYRVVHGNHDAALAASGVPDVDRFVAGGRRFVVLHGHQFDGALKRLPGVSATGSWLAAWLRRVDLDAHADRLVELGFWANRACGWLGFAGGSRPPRGPEEATVAAESGVHEATDGRARGLGRDERGALSVLAAEQADYVVMGHVHRTRLRHFGARGRYVNGGHCSFGNVSFASIDTRTQAVRLFSSWADADGLHRAIAAARRTGVSDTP